jgi:hypothetical protein
MSATPAGNGPRETAGPGKISILQAASGRERARREGKVFLRH